MSKNIFLGPIWPHYRKSLIDELIKEKPETYFYGAENYLTNRPLKNNKNIKNVLKKYSFNFFKHKFFWYKNIFSKINFKRADKIVIVGFDPHMLHLIVLVLYLKFFLRKEFYWWSHANYGSQGKLGRVVRYWFYRRGKGVLSYAKEGKNRLINLGMDLNRIAVLNNCLNYEDYGWMQYNLLEDNDIKKNDDFKIILTGKLNKEKKIHLLIEAMEVLRKSNQNIFCTILGDGQEKDNLQKLVQEKKLTSFINFTGAKFGKEAHKFLLESDLYIIPGAVGLSIVHGFSFGLPILTSDNEQIHRPEIDLLERGINGDFYIDGSPNSLAAKIIEWKLKLKREGRIKYAKNCIESIKTKNYLPKGVANNILKKING